MITAIVALTLVGLGVYMTARPYINNLVNVAGIMPSEELTINLKKKLTEASKPRLRSSSTRLLESFRDLEKRGNLFALTFTSIIRRAVVMERATNIDDVGQFVKEKVSALHNGWDEQSRKARFHARVALVLMIISLGLIMKTLETIFVDDTSAVEMLLICGGCLFAQVFALRGNFRNFIPAALIFKNTRFNVETFDTRWFKEIYMNASEPEFGGGAAQNRFHLSSHFATSWDNALAIAAQTTSHPDDND